MIGSWNIMERAFLILFHALSGALIGWGLQKTSKILISIVSGMVLINTLFRYLPIMIQQQLVTVEAMHLIIASITVLLLLVTMLMLKKQKQL